MTQLNEQGNGRNDQGDYHRQAKKAQKKFKGGDELNFQIVEKVIKLDQPM